MSKIELLGLLGLTTAHCLSLILAEAYYVSMELSFFLFRQVRFTFLVYDVMTVNISMSSNFVYVFLNDKNGNFDEWIIPKLFILQSAA